MTYFLKKIFTRFKKNCASHNDRQRFTTLTLQGGRKMLINWENKSPFVFTTHGSGSPKKRFVRQGRQSYVVSLSLCVFRQDRFTWHYCRLYFLIYKLVNSVFFPCTSSYTKTATIFLHFTRLYENPHPVNVTSSCFIKLLLFTRLFRAYPDYSIPDISWTEQIVRLRNTCLKYCCL